MDIGRSEAPRAGSGRVVVVGSGMGGLAAAMVLAASGAAVTVLEKEGRPGGKLREVAVGGRAVDSGPTVLTMRPVFEALFAAAGARLGDHLALTQAEIVARHHWEDGSRLDLFADVGRSAEAIAAFAGPREARAYRAFCDTTAATFRTLDRPFMQNPEPGLGALVRAGGIGGLPALSRIRAFSTLWQVVASHFQDPRLRQLFARYATYCGSSPFAAPGPLMLVAHVEQAGVWLVEPGMAALARAAETVARAAGAEFRYGAEVAEVLVHGGTARGVRLTGGEEVEADAVLLNADPAALSAGLFGEAARAAGPAWAPQQRSLSALTLSMVGRAGGFPLARHTVFFSADYGAEFDAIFGRGRLPADPTVYLCAQDRGAAGGPPADGRERLFAIVNAPASADRAPLSDQEVRTCIDAIMARLRRAGLELEIEADGPEATTPAAFARLFPATGGALYGRSSHGWMASFQRPTARTRIRGLYLCGGATHPGPGLPMAALSGRHAATAIMRDFASTATSRRTAMPGGTSTR